MAQGQTGKVTIAGVEYCLREDGCVLGMAGMAPPASQTRCDEGNNFCIKATSYKRNAGVWKSIGTKVEQTKGGYKKSWGFCWGLGFIPWACSKTSGVNELGITNHYQVSTTGIVGKFVREGGKSNVTSVKVQEWSLFAGLKVKNDGTWGVGGGADLAIDGVCGYGDGNGTGGSASTKTSKGSVDFACPEIIY